MYYKRINTAGTVENAPGFNMGGDIGCCPDNSNPVCKFVFVVTDLTAITSITIDGNVHTITATDETDPGQIAMAINQAFIDEGYFGNGTPSVDVYRNDWADTETVILIYANADSVTMVTVPVADTNGVENCIQTVACRYSLEVEVGALDIDLFDSDVEEETAADSPQTVAGTYATGAADTLGSDLYDGLLLLYANTTNAVVKRVKVVEDVPNAVYKIQVWLMGHRPFTAILSGETENLVTKNECKLDYTVAN